MPLLGRPSELIEPGTASSRSTVRGKGLPFCSPMVALFDTTAPDADSATLASAASVPHRGPEAL